ncbi:MAG: hypothetical protein IT368_13160, partial [Candidatus Hydrogenedentes bacterium]|nr:hypothetical protein [Candidatus Hydrogenedentota bacterium]
EGEGEGEGEAIHSADRNSDGNISLQEVLRVIQFFNVGSYGCQSETEDGYAPGAAAHECTAHASDYAPQDWDISISELLRLIQFFNANGYHACATGEDGYCPGLT